MCVLIFENTILLKIYLRRLHLFLALGCALFLMSLSISGALLIYAKNLQSAINPDYWQVTPNAKAVINKVLPLSTLIEKIAVHTKDKINFIEVSNTPEAAWKVRLVNSSYLNVNPYNGDILLTYSFYDSFYGFVMAWHRWLLYTNEEGEKPFQLWISIASLVFMIEALIGSYLWLKPKHRLKRLKVKLKAKNRIRFYQLHGSLGIILCLPLVLIAFSGIAFFWSDASKQVVEWLTDSKIEQHNYQTTVAVQAKAYQLDKAYYAASTGLSDGEVYRIYLPSEKDQALALRIKMPNESHAYSWSWANPYTGELLQSFDASKTSIATRVWNFKYKFHIGEFIGWPVKIIWLFIALTPCFLVMSGVYLWLKRKFI